MYCIPLVALPSSSLWEAAKLKAFSKRPVGLLKSKHALVQLWLYFHFEVGYKSLFTSCVRDKTEMDYTSALYQNKMTKSIQNETRFNCCNLQPSAIKNTSPGQCTARLPRGISQAIHTAVRTLHHPINWLDCNTDNYDGKTSPTFPDLKKKVSYPRPESSEGTPRPDCN